MALSHATRLSEARKEQGAHSITDLPRRAPSFPTISGLPARIGLRPTAAITIPTLRVIPAATAPYAQMAVVIPEHQAWRQRMAANWVRWRLLIGAAIVALAATLIVTSAQRDIGIILLAVALGVIALESIAARCLEFQMFGSVAVLTLIADLALLAVGIALIGPRSSLLLLLPGSLLITALLAETWTVIAGGAFAFLGFGAAALAQTTGRIAPLAVLSPAIATWIDLMIVLTGLGVMLVAIVLAAGMVRRALGNEAAAVHRLHVQERRANAKQIAIDADAIALQAALAETLRGGEPHAVTTCEDLAPLANMINATTARLPGLLNDREERLRLEKGVRGLADKLEAAWAGFAWSWPQPSGTAVDRLVEVLRPHPSPLHAGE